MFLTKEQMNESLEKDKKKIVLTWLTYNAHVILKESNLVWDDASTKLAEEVGNNFELHDEEYTIHEDVYELTFEYCTKMAG